MKKSKIISLFIFLSIISSLSAKPKEKKQKESFQDDSILEVTLDEKEKETEKLEEEVKTEPDMTLFANWKKVPNRKVDKTFGKIRLRVLPKRGSFNIGIDIQNRRDIDIDRLSQRYFSKGEQSFIYETEGDPITHFFTLWTRKEALCKYTGKGLSQVISGESVSAGAGTGRRPWAHFT